MIRESAMARTRVKMQERLAATRPATWGKVGAGVLLGGLAIGWFAFPWVLDKVVASQINLAQGKDSRRLWIQLPAFDCHMYVFNITNPDEVMQGAKPAVKEVGPYCYKEIKDKTDFVEDPVSDTISYSARTTWIVNQKDPKCPAPYLTGDEMVVVPNIPMLAILLIAEKDFPPPFLTLVNQALPTIFGKFNDIFMRVSAKDLLFDGIPIDCTATALYPRAVCIALKQNSRALKKVGENRYSFSFFGAKNYTPEEFRYTVKRGTEDGQDIGRLVAFDGKPELPFWRGECNKLQGTDGSVFPPFRQKENGSLMAYSAETCRVLIGTYMGEYDYKGVTGYAYTTIFADTETNPADRCFCPADDKCRKKGVLDTLKCVGAPIVTSHPHFYLANQEYVDGVTGLNPDKDKHGIIIVLEPISGSPLYARKRIQFNIDLKPIRYITVTQRLPRVLVPLFWAEEGLDLDQDLMGMLEASLFRPIRAVDVLKWMAVATGVGLAVTAAVLKIRKNRRDKVHTLKGEAGKEFGHESEPKEVVQSAPDDKPTHPFYINTEEDKSQKTGINGMANGTNGLSAEAFKKENLNSDVEQTLTGINETDTPTQPINGILSNGINHDVPSAPIFKNGEDQISLQDETTVTFGVPDKSNQGETDSAIQPVNLMRPASNTSTVFNERLQKSHAQMSSLEHQTSVISSYPEATTTSPNRVKSADEMSHFLPPNGNPQQTSYESLSQPPSGDPQVDTPLNSINMEVITVEDKESFNETTETRHDLESNNEQGPENGFQNDVEINTTSQQLTSDETNTDTDITPTAEELRAVEDDINKLVAEMAQLLPKRN